MARTIHKLLLAWLLLLGALLLVQAQRGPAGERTSRDYGLFCAPMLLGVYWYYGFPAGLYAFDFFAFCPGRGGHAELTATGQAPNPAALLAAVRAVAARYPSGYLFGKAHGPLLHLDLGDYALTDYTFHVARELENVLREQQATPTTEPLPPDTPLLRLAAPPDPAPPYQYGAGRLQAVSSRPGKHRAEVALLCLDCHLLLPQKAGFLAALDTLCG